MKIFLKGIKSTDNISEPMDNRVSVSLAKNEPLTRATSTRARRRNRRSLTIVSAIGSALREAEGGGA